MAITCNFTGTPLTGVSPLTVEYTDTSTGGTISTWSWDFGDGKISTEQNPSHIYKSPGYYTVSLMVNSIATEIKEDYIYVTMPNIIATGSLKTANKFITLGWIKNPITTTSDYLVPLAVSDQWGNVEASDKSIMFKIYKEGTDYRLGFNNSRSKLIKKTLKISLNDKKWHLLGWVCLNNNGAMKYIIDDYTLEAEEGVDTNDLEYSIAYSYDSRQGGTDVWCPYIYKGSQSMNLYNWRFGQGFILDDDVIRKLNAEDRINLNI
jgi:PKD repeat protein